MTRFSLLFFCCIHSLIFFVFCIFCFNFFYEWVLTNDWEKLVSCQFIILLPSTKAELGSICVLSGLLSDSMWCCLVNVMRVKYMIYYLFIQEQCSLEIVQRSVFVRKLYEFVCVCMSNWIKASNRKLINENPLVTFVKKCKSKSKVLSRAWK